MQIKPNRFKAKLGADLNDTLSNPPVLIKIIKDEFAEFPKDALVLEAAVKFGIPIKYLRLNRNNPVDAIVQRWIYDFVRHFPIQFEYAVSAIFFWGEILGIRGNLKLVRNITKIPFEKKITLRTMSKLNLGKTANVNNLSQLQLEGLLRDECNGFTREIIAIAYCKDYIERIRKTKKKIIRKEINEIAQEVSQELPIDHYALESALELWSILLKKIDPPTIIEIKEKDLLDNKITEKIFLVIKHDTIFVTKDLKSAQSKNNISVSEVIFAASVDINAFIILLSNEFRLYCLPAKSITNILDRTFELPKIIKISHREYIINALTVSKTDVILLGSNQGRFKKIPSSNLIQLKLGRKVLPSLDDDHLCFIEKVTDSNQLLIISSDGRFRLLGEELIPFGNLRSYGKKLIQLNSKELVVSTIILSEITQKENVFLISSNGYIKQLKVEDISRTKTERLYRENKNSGKLISAFIGNKKESVLHVRTKNNIIAKVGLAELGVLKIQSQGKKTVHTAQGDKILELVIEKNSSELTILYSILTTMFTKWIWNIEIKDKTLVTNKQKPKDFTRKIVIDKEDRTKPYTISKSTPQISKGASLGEILAIIFLVSFVLGAIIFCFLFAYILFLT